MKELSPKKSPDTESQHKRKAIKKHPAVDDAPGKPSKRTSPSPLLSKGKKSRKVVVEEWVETASGSAGPSKWSPKWVSIKETTKINQDRVEKGKSWRYAVTADQVLGCSNCRFIFNGCGLCRKKDFRGKSAQQLWEEEDKFRPTGSEEGGEEIKKAKKSKGGKKKVKKSKGPEKKLSA